VIDESNRGVPDLTVQAFDDDPEILVDSDDRLGNATTGVEGSFEIEYSPDSFRAWYEVFEGSPDRIRLDSNFQKR
jgi:hypothetical protein